MKKFHFTILLVLFRAGIGMAQIYSAFHENFEPPFQADSLFSSQVASPGSNDWVTNDRLQVSGTWSDSCQVKDQAVVLLTSVPVNTQGYTWIELHFDHICKVNFFDTATLEVSTNGGLSWIRLTGNAYMGSGSYASNYNRFNAASYGGLWKPVQASAVPENSWWKHEVFNVSSLLQNCPQAMIRFRLADGGPVGPGGNAGWYLDNVRIDCALSEMTPPLISWISPLSGMVFQDSGVPVKAVITDGSGIDTAMVIYSVNGGFPDTLGMTFLQGDTLGAVFPVINNWDEICFSILAVDASLSHNVSSLPVSSCFSFQVYNAIQPPFFDSFEQTNFWTPAGTGSTQWEKGTPAFGQTNSTHSGTQAWDVNLDTAYAAYADCKLYSPVFDVSSYQNPLLSFWINFHTETNADGVYMEYSTNGSNWQLLGTLNDPYGNNWYTGFLAAPAQKPAWSGSSSGWRKVRYSLAHLNLTSSRLQFRFVFISNGYTQSSGCSIDDFGIRQNGVHELGLGKILSPVSGCIAGTNPVTFTVKNCGIDTISSGITASYQVHPNNIINESLPGILAPGDSVSFSFQTPLEILNGLSDTTYHLKVWVNHPDDPDQSDDTLSSVIVSKFIPPPPLVTHTSCIYGGQVTLTASSSYPVRWYASPVGGATLSSNLTYITPYLYQTTVYYVSAFSASGCFSSRIPDTVYVNSQMETDMELNLLYKPVSGPYLTASETVKIRMRNLGTLPVSGTSVSYILNSEPIVTEPITTTLNPGDTLSYAFLQPVNLELMQYYTIKVWTSTPGDSIFQNDTLKRTFVHTDFTYCTAIAQSGQDADIGNFTLNNISSGNGIPVLNNPLATGTYTNFTQELPPIILAKDHTYPISISPIFRGGSSYANCVRVFADWNHNGLFEFPDEIAFTSGPIQTGSHSGTLHVPANAVQAYTRLRVILKETTDPNTIFPCNDYSWGETEDYSAYVYSPLVNDAGVSLITQPAAVVSQNSSVPCAVRITNFGLTSIQQMNIRYTLDAQPSVLQGWNGLLLPGEQIEIALSPITPDSGYHSLCVIVELAGDLNTANDKYCKTILATELTPLPYSNSFDNLAAEDFIPSGGTATTWIHGSPAAGNFPFQGPCSAPGIWATNLNMAGYSNNALACLTTPLFDFSHAFNARIKFRYTMNTQLNADGVRLEYSDNAGTTWHPLGVLYDPLGINWNITPLANQGPGWSGTEPDWKNASFLLSQLNYTSGIQFRFVFSSNGSTTYQGFALDDFQVSLPCPTDLAMDSILLPLPVSQPAQQPVPVQVKIRNIGADTVHMINVSYQLNSGSPVTEILTIPQGLKPEESVLYTFSSQPVIPAGFFTLLTRVTIGGDCSVLNDTLSIHGEGIPVFLPVYSTNFDTSGITGWSSTGSCWEFGSPASSIIDSAFSAPFCWKTKLNSYYPATNELHYLYTPYFSGAHHLDSLVFRHRYHIANGDFGRVEYLSTNGWQKLGYFSAIHATNWYNTVSGFSLTSPGNTWIRSAVSLEPYMDFADPIRFRFVFNGFQTNGSWDGWAIDDISLSARIPMLDAGISGIQQPFWICQAGDSLHVQVSLNNFGVDTLVEIPVKYSINGVVQAEEVSLQPLLSEQTIVYQFSNTLHIPGSNFEIKVYSDFAEDQDRTNDSIQMTIQVIGNEEINRENPQLKIIPTPCNTTCIAQLWLNCPGAVRITLQDISGKILLTREIAGQPGLNAINLDVSGLSAGSYSCSVVSGGQLFCKKLMIVR